MKKLSFILTIMIGLGLSSCSYVGRYVNPSKNLNLNQTQVVLSEANFRVVKHVSLPVIYTQSAMRFDSDQLKQSAYAELLRKANLTGSQALINVTVELVERRNEMSAKKECAIIGSGIVIEFINPNAPQEEVISGGSLISDGSLHAGGTIQGGEILQSTPSIEPAQPTLEEKLYQEYLALKEIEGQSIGDKSLLKEYKEAELVIINASTATRRECEVYKNNFKSGFNQSMKGIWKKDFTLSNHAKGLMAELIIVDYNGGNANGFIRFKDENGDVLYSVCLLESNVQGQASTLVNTLRSEF